MVLTSYINNPEMPAKVCIIWMHGLGADASDMAGLAEQYPIRKLPCRHVFIDAPVRSVTINGGMRMRAWYDIVGKELIDREDKFGIIESERAILDTIQSQIDSGFTANQIILAGFSQGGAMALYTAINNELPLGGVMSLSAYLPIAHECTPKLPTTTPFFLAYGDKDPVVSPVWTQQSKDWLLSHGYDALTWHKYPMEHSICPMEIEDIYEWLSYKVIGGQGE